MEVFLFTLVPPEASLGLKRDNVSIFSQQVSSWEEAKTLNRSSVCVSLSWTWAFVLLLENLCGIQDPSKSVSNTYWNKRPDSILLLHRGFAQTSNHFLKESEQWLSSAWTKRPWIQASLSEGLQGLFVMSQGKRKCSPHCAPSLYPLHCRK